MRRILPLAAVATVAGCAAPGPAKAPAETTRVIAAEPALVRERMDRAVLGLGFVPGGPGPDAPYRRSSVPSDWASCPNVVISGPDDASQRDWARPMTQDGEVRLRALPDQGGTRAEVITHFRATYLNRYRGHDFTRACDSTGRLEQRILDDAAAAG
ncbi:MAG: hypothetical protein U1E14_06420 [Geminicoccaceae bacterium]